MPTTVMVHGRRRPVRRRNKLPLALGLALLLMSALAVYFIFFFPRDIKRISYPLLYKEEIRQAAEAEGLDPARVAAVVFCESSFRPDAVSSVGARGLMQIMPDTGEWLSGKFEGMAYSDELLFDPATNLKLGCWYLNYLDDLFQGDLATATAAFHTGQGRVGEWVQDPENSSDGLRLDKNIPSEVTGAYVRKVQSVYDYYKEQFDEA